MGRAMLLSSFINFPAIYFSNIPRDKNVTILSVSCNSNSIGLDDKKIRWVKPKFCVNSNSGGEQSEIHLGRQTVEPAAALFTT